MSKNHLNPLNCTCTQYYSRPGQCSVQQLPSCRRRHGVLQWCLYICMYMYATLLTGDQDSLPCAIVCCARAFFQGHYDLARQSMVSQSYGPSRRAMGLLARPWVFSQGQKRTRKAKNRCRKAKIRTRNCQKRPHKAKIDLERPKTILQGQN